MDDSKIVSLYWDRNEQAITESEEKYGEYCYRIAFYILNEKNDADESVNDTWLAAWNSMPPHRPSVLKTFLGKLTRRISINKWNNNTAQKRGGGRMEEALSELAECLPDKSSPENEAETELLKDILSDFVRSLKPMERKLFMGKYWHLYSIEQLANAYGFTQSKVKSMLLRTRKKLKQRLTEEGFE